MKTLFIKTIAVAILILTSGINSNAREVLVRKKVIPNFFMPDNAMKRTQKNFPVPQYSSGTTETIKEISNPKNDTQRVVTRTSEFGKISQPKQESTKTPEDVSKINPTSNKDGCPEYQMKYQEYLDSLKYVAEGKKMPKDKLLEADLARMNSNQKELIDKQIIKDKEFNKKRNSQIDKTFRFDSKDSAEDIEARQQNIINNLGR